MLDLAAGALISGGAALQLVLILIGTGGFGGTVVALFKLKPDANSAAVTQAQGAMEVLARANTTLEQERDEARRERDEWRARAEAAERSVAELRGAPPPV